MEAMYYRKAKNGVVCELCPHACFLREGETGKCQVRQCIQLGLQTNSYGLLSAVNTDPIEKKPLYHFLPTSKSLSVATKGCILSCLNCQNWEISQAGPENHDGPYVPPDEIIQLALSKNSKSISYTYTDPVAYYEYMYETARLAAQNGIKNVMVSSGYINSLPLKQLLPYLDAANIDLKCFSDRIYRKLCGAKLQPVLDALQIILEAGVWLEITNLIIPGWTDDRHDIMAMCRWLVKNGFDQVPLHFSRFMPTYKLRDARATPEKTLEEALDMAKSAGMKYVYIGNVTGSDFVNTTCPGCGTLLIRRHGYQTELVSGFNGVCAGCDTAIPGRW